MTNKEYLSSVLGFMPDKNSIDGTLLVNGVEKDDEFDPEEEPEVVVKLRLCEIRILEILLSTPDMTNENGFVIKYDRKAVEARLNLLKIKSGLVTETIAQPKIQNRSYLW